MKKSIFFLSGISALVLILSVLAGCDDGLEEFRLAEAADNVLYGQIGTPDVTETLITGGVLLSWPPIIEASRYEIWRQGSGDPQPAAVQLQTVYPGNVNEDTGVIEYLDIVSFTNELKADTQYTYTILTFSVGPKTFSRWEKQIVTGTFPVQGSKAATPAAVDMAVNYGVPSITVTVTPPTAGNIPNGYAVRVGKNSSTNIVDFTIPRNSLNSFTKTVYMTDNYVLSLYNLLEANSSDFVVEVTAFTSISDSYYEAANIFTIEKKVEPLFGSNSYLSVSIDPIFVVSPLPLIPLRAFLL